MSKCRPRIAKVGSYSNFNTSSGYCKKRGGMKWGEGVGEKKGRDEMGEERGRDEWKNVQSHLSYKV